MIDMNTELARALQFSADDLAARRRGALTDAQKGVLRQASWANLPRLIVLIVLGGFLLIVGFAPGLAINQRVIILLGLAVVIWALIATIQRLLQFSDDQAAARVEAIEGEAKATSVRVKYGREHYVEIGATPFRVNAPVAAAIEPIRYRAYYAPISMTLLSAEPLEDEPLSAKEAQP